MGDMFPKKSCIILGNHSLYFNTPVDCSIFAVPAEQGKFEEFCLDVNLVHFCL